MRIIVVGGGLAGLSAAIPLARDGIDVTVLEAGETCGSRHGSAGLIHADPLAGNDRFAKNLLDDAPWHREITRRDQFSLDGQRLSGYRYSNDRAFRRQYTVNPSSFNEWMAEKARRAGATIHPDTTARSLIRHDRRVVGVHTSKGPVYGDGVFLAEGDRAELSDREQLERQPPSQPVPHNLHIQQTVAVSPARIESMFDLSSDREGAFVGINLPLPETENDPSSGIVRSWLFPLADAVAMGLSLTIDDGDHQRLSAHRALEWLSHQPPFDELLGDGEITHVESTVKRTNRKRPPNLVDHGVALGGAAAGLGQSFPIMDHSGPAIETGIQFARAMRQVTEISGEMDRDSLRQYYEKPLLNSKYAGSNRFLRTVTDSLDDNVDHPLLTGGFPIHPSTCLSRFLDRRLLNHLDVTLMSLLLTNLSISRAPSHRPDGKLTVVMRCYADSTDDKISTTDGLIHQILTPLFDQLHRSDGRNLRERLTGGIQAVLRDLSVYDWGRALLSAISRPFEQRSNTGPTSEPNTSNEPADKPTHETERSEGATGSEHPLILYSSGYLQPSSAPTSASVCPTHVFGTELDAGNRSVEPERCVLCGACRGRVGHVEYSGLSKASGDEGNTFPSSKDSAEEWLGALPDADSLQPLPPRLGELARRLENQLEAWLDQFRRRKLRVSPDDARWLMTLARSASTTLRLMEETLGDHHGDLDRWLGEIDDLLQRVQADIANRQLFWASATVDQLLDHHLSLLDRAVSFPDQFPFPYEAFHRREQYHQGSEESTDQIGLSPSRQARDFVRRTLGEYPHPEIFGHEPEGLDTVVSALETSLSDDSHQPTEQFREIGQHNNDDPFLTQLRELSEDEERLWQEAGRYNVIADLVEQWRQWSGELSRLGNADEPCHRTLRGRLHADLWATRETINRIHTRLMTGHEAKRAVDLLRVWTWGLEERMAHAKFCIRNSDTLISIGRQTQSIRPDQTSTTDPSPELDRSNLPSVTFLTTPGKFPVNPDSVTTPSEWPESTSAHSGEAIRTLITYLKDQAPWQQTDVDTDEQALLKGSFILKWMGLDALLTESVRCLPPSNGTSPHFMTSLFMIQGYHVMEAHAEQEFFPRQTVPTLNIDVETVNTHYRTCLNDILEIGGERFRKTESPELPHDHLDPLYEVLREGVLGLGQRIDPGDVTKPQAKPLYRLADCAAEFAAIVSLYRRFQALQENDDTSPDLLSAYENLVPLARRQSQSRMNHLGEKIDQIRDGIEHGITPPEQRIRSMD